MQKYGETIKMRKEDAMDKLEVLQIYDVTLLYIELCSNAVKSYL